MTPEVIATICDHAQGNLRALMIMAGELLGRRRPARGPPDRRDAVLRNLRRGRRPRGQGGEPAPAMTQLPVQPAWRLAELPEQQRWLVDRAVVGRSRRHHRRRAKMLQILPRPRSGRRRRRRHALPAPLRGAPAPVASCSIPPRTRCTSSAAASRASAPPPASVSPNSTSR